MTEQPGKVNNSTTAARFGMGRAGVATTAQTPSAPDHREMKE